MPGARGKAKAATQTIEEEYVLHDNPMMFYKKRPMICLIKRERVRPTNYVSCSYTKVRERVGDRFIKIYDIEMGLISELCVVSNDQ